MKGLVNTKTGACSNRSVNIFQDISRHFKTFQDISRHFKTFQDISTIVDKRFGGNRTAQNLGVENVPAHAHDPAQGSSTKDSTPSSIMQRHIKDSMPSSIVHWHIKDSTPSSIVQWHIKDSTPSSIVQWRIN